MMGTLYARLLESDKYSFSTVIASYLSPVVIFISQF